MKDILDQINGMFETLYDTVTGNRPDSGDPLLDAAWQELDQFMKTDKPGNPTAFRDMDREFAAFDRQFNPGKPESDFENLKAQARNAQNQTHSQNQNRPNPEDPLITIARELVRDYHNLEIKPGAAVDEVKAAYKTMIKQYHPDRFAHDPAKQATATAITSKLNQSYARIMEHLGAR